MSFEDSCSGYATDIGKKRQVNSCRIIYISKCIIPNDFISVRVCMRAHFYAHKSNFIHVQTIFRILIHHTCGRYARYDKKPYIILNVGIVFEWTLPNILPLILFHIVLLLLLCFFFMLCSNTVSYCFCIPSRIVFIYVK